MVIDLEEIIKYAIAKEEGSHEFYMRMAKLASHADTKDTFEYLAKEEREHKAFLQSCLTPQGCKLVGEAHNVHLAELLEVPVFSEALTPKDALIIAMKREEELHQLYQKLASLQPPGGNRDFLNKMAQMSLGHKEKVEYLYTNVAFPEVW
jgi:rubrerythrin